MEKYTLQNKMQIVTANEKKSVNLKTFIDCYVNVFY